MDHKRAGLFYRCTGCGAMMELEDLDSVATCTVCGTPDNHWNSDED